MTSTDADIRADARAWMAAHSAEMQEALAAAIQIPSLPCTVEQNDVHDVVADMVGTAPGVRADRWRPDWDAVRAMHAPLDDQQLWVPLHERDVRYAEVLPELECRAWTVGGDGPALVINGHVDVVPADDQPWSTKPFNATVRDGWMYGRGTMDMKGGLVAAGFAFRYLAEHWDGPGSVTLLSVVEEETGGNGTLAALLRGHVGDAVVLAESTNLRVVHRHVGIQAFEITVSGRAGGMLRRSWGTSAVPPLARVLSALDEFERERTARAHRAGGYEDDDLPGFINVGFVSGGEWLATRAAKATASGLMGILPGETQDQAGEELTARVREAVGDEADVDVRVVIPPGGHRGAELDVDHRLVQSFSLPGAAPDSAGGPSRAGTMVCDAKIVQGGGWAPCAVLGPVGEGLHSADEKVDLASVEECAAMLVAGAFRYA